MKNNVQLNNFPGIFWLIVSLLLIFLLSLFVGTFSFSSLYFPNFFSETEIAIFQMRLIRSCTAIFCGYILAISGFYLQTMTQNSMACPSLLGVSSAIGFFVSLIAAISTTFSNETFNFVYSNFVAGFIGFFVFLVAFSFQKKQESESKEILIGVSVNLFFGALTTICISFLTPWNLSKVQNWMFGHISSFDWKGTVLLGIVSLFFSLLTFRGFDRFLLGNFGPTFAKSVFSNWHSFRFFVLICTGFAVVCSVVICGPISFVGLVAPHLLSSSKLGRIPFCVGIVGAMLLLVSDLTSRLVEVFQPDVGYLPVGVFTALFGAPFLIFKTLGTPKREFLANENA